MQTIPDKREMQIALIGTGAVAQAFLSLFKKNELKVAAISGRDTKKSQHLAKQFDVKSVGSNYADAVSNSNILFICVSDDGLSSVIEFLSRTNRLIEKKYIFHTSGVQSSAILDPLRQRGSHCASFHPLQTLPKESNAVSLDGYAVVLEGDSEAVAVGVEIARLLNADPLTIQPEQKVLYHTAATIASNGLVALAGVVEELTQNLQLGENAIVYFYKLMQQSLHNSVELTAQNALTGPIARGDITTIKHHLNQLRQDAPHILPLYVILGSHCVSLALQKRVLSSERSDEILQLFSQQLQYLTT